MSTKTINTGIYQATKQRIGDYKLLLKFRLNLLVVFSAVMAYLIAVPAGSLSWVAVGVLALGGFLVTGASNALNQVLEREYDGLMNRTAKRPLPAGRMTVSEAVLAAGLMSLVGIVLLALFNPLTSLLAMISLVVYAFLYTPMKRVSPLAVFIGAIPGALPTMIGVVAYEAGLTPLALILFGIQFFWQFPHFWAVAWLAHEDYAKAGFHLLPSKRGVKDENAGRQSFIFALLMLPLGILPFYLGITGIFSAVFVSLVGLVYAYYSWAFFTECSRAAARKLMFCSFFYLPMVLIALFIDKI